MTVWGSRRKPSWRPTPPTKKQLKYLGNLARRGGHADVHCARAWMEIRCRMDEGSRRPEAATLLDAEGSRLDVRSASALIGLLLRPPALRVGLPPGGATMRFASEMDSITLRWTRRT